MELELFLGFPVDKTFENLLQDVAPAFIAVYIQNNNNDYLQEFWLHQTKYLGKKVGSLVQISQLNLFEANIFSLVSKLVPNYPYSKDPLFLFPITKQ